MLDLAVQLKVHLELVRPEKWAEAFVNVKMEFFRCYGRGLISSCEHGVNYFDNVIGLCRGTLEWKEKGEYGENFRKMVKDRPRN